MRQYDVGFFSSADRGLECLLDMIPKVEKQLGRKIKSVWAYGWNTFDQMHAKNPQMMKWKWTIIKKMHDVGMESKGRLSHQELADLMKDTKVWAYPTLFTEIFCITAIKALAAGMIPVTTGVGALLETQGDFGYTVKCVNIYEDEEEQVRFIDAVVQALKQKDYDSAPQQKWVERYSWSKIATDWDRTLSDSGKEVSSL